MDWEVREWEERWGRVGVWVRECERGGGGRREGKPTQIWMHYYFFLKRKNVSLRAKQIIITMIGSKIF